MRIRPYPSRREADHPPSRTDETLRSGGVPEPTAPARQQVPWRTIWAAILAVGVTFVGYQAFLAIGRIITYLVVALFFAIVLTPPVDFLQYRMKFRRGLATLVVLFIGLLVLAALIYAFVHPIVDQAQKFSKDLPQYVQDAKDGRGPIGSIVKRYDLEQKVKDNQDKINQALTDFGKSGLTYLQTIFSTIVAGLTVI